MVGEEQELHSDTLSACDVFFVVFRTCVSSWADDFVNFPYQIKRCCLK